VLSGVLALAALAAGLTGAWSPCGFSMVETLAPHGYAGRLRTTLLACATFSVGALAGGVVTFGGLALLGSALGAGAPGVAALLAIAGAAAEARGLRIVPQVRRQVPEAWRRVLPVPLAAGLYGVLLGLGFTTFILSFAVWALAGIAVALGDPALGALVGIAFGVGRALPVVALAPSGGGRAVAAMAERPAILRGLRRADAVALLACAVALAAAPAQAQGVLAADASDPTADGDAVAWHRPSAPGVLLRGFGTFALPGQRPALGGGRLAWHDGADVVVADPATLTPQLRVSAPGATALAISAGWVAWRARGITGGDAILAAPLAASPELQPGGTVLAAALGAEGLSRPALAGDRLAYGVAGARGSRIVAVDLRTGVGATLRQERGSQLSNPALQGDRLLYVRATATRQELRLGVAAAGSTRGDRVLYAIRPTGRGDRGYEPGRRPHRRAPRRPLAPAGVADTLWTTALGAREAFVTRLRQRRWQAARATVLRVAR